MARRPFSPRLNAMRPRAFAPVKKGLLNLRVTHAPEESSPMTPAESHTTSDTSAATPVGVKGERGWLLAVMLLAVALRLVKLGSRDFWHDEAHNLLKSEQLGKVLFEGDLVSNHPPLFAILVTAWRALGLGLGEWSVRFVPLILGVCGVGALYVLGKRMYGARAGLFAAFLLAIAPLHVYHSQDLKVYILLPFTGTVMTYFLYRASQTNARRDWACYGLSAAVACYSELFVAPMLVAINLWFLFQWVGNRDNRIKRWALANLVGALLFVPQLSVMLRKFSVVVTSPEQWWIPWPTPTTVAFYLKTLSFGYGDFDPLFKIALALFLIAAGAGFAVALKRNRSAAVLLAMWFVLSPLLIIALSYWGGQSLFLFRALLPYAIPFYLFAGLAVSRLPKVSHRVVGATAFAIIAACGLSARYLDQYALTEFPHRPGVHPTPAFHAAADYVSKDWREGDTVIMSGNASGWPMYWYGLRVPHHLAIIGNDRIKFWMQLNPWNSARPDFQGIYYPKDVETIVRDKNRVWFEFSEWERQYFGGNASLVWLWMDAHYSELAHETFNPTQFAGLEVFQYAANRDGTPIREVARDEDDGVQALVTYRADEEWQYLKTRPDMGLVASTPEARRGRMNLRFVDKGAEETVNLAGGADVRTVSVSLENRSTETVEYSIEVVLSYYLVELASFDDPDPEADVWFVNKTYNQDGVPQSYDVAVATAQHPGQGEFLLEGTVPLAAGEYTGFVRLLGSPDSPGLRRSRVRMLAAGQDLLAQVPAGDAGPMKWAWHPIPQIEVQADAARTVIEVVASGLDDGEPSWADLAFVAFQKRSGPGSADLAAPTPGLWRDSRAIAPREESSWRVGVDADVRRVDVWVYESGPKGRAYRIYREF